jgi:hypothetical protein
MKNGCPKTKRKEKEMSRFFISGHIDLSEEEFRQHYIPPLELAIAAKDASFVVGDAPGADTMAQTFLHSHGIHNVTVFHKGPQPKCNCFPEKWKTSGPFTSHSAKDAAMTDASDHDILYIRSAEETKQRLGDKYDPSFVSGTQANFNRRMKGNKNKLN